MQLYVLVLIVLGIISAVMSIKDIAILVVMLTFGLGFPFVFAATCLIYALLAYPAVAMWPNGGRDRLVGCAASLGLAILFAVMPNVVARFEANRQTEVLLADDRTPDKPVSARTLEVRRPPSDYSGFFADQEACGFECRSLLKSGRVDWVRIVKVDSRRRRVINQQRPRPVQWVNDDTSTSSFFVGRSGSACAGTTANVPAAERCVALANDTGAVADLVVEIQRPQVIEAKPGAFDFVVWRSTRTITAQLRSAAGPAAAFRHTIVDAEVVMMPTIIGPKFSGMSSSGTALMRSSKQINKVNFTQVLSTLGLPVGATAGAAPEKPKPRNWKNGIDDEMTRELVSVLELPQATSLNTDQAKPVIDWLTHARQVKEWTPELIALLRRILHDRRLMQPTNFDQIFERNRRVTEALMPDVLELLETHGVTSTYTAERQAAYTFTRLDPQVLRPHASRITALIRRDKDLRGILLPAVGRLGIDPVPYLAPLTADLMTGERSSMSNGYARVRGACYAESQWAPALIPVLRQAVGSNGSATAGDRRHVEFERKVLGALANLGDTAFVEQALESRSDNDAKRLVKQVRTRAGDPRWANSMCSSF